MTRVSAASLFRLDFAADTSVRVIMRQAKNTIIDDIGRTLDGLETMPREDLIRLWRQTYGAEPPKAVSRRLLERAAAYHLQTEAYGGLDAATRRTLLKYQRRADQPRQKAQNKTLSPKARLAPGVRLIREWNGTTHMVEVGEDGYLFDGKRWRSLSAIAKAITGAHWSGPRFFGQ